MDDAEPPVIGAGRVDPFARSHLGDVVIQVLVVPPHGDAHVVGLAHRPSHSEFWANQAPCSPE